MNILVSLRICFNSLCAYASVNHLHWHILYLKSPMFIQVWQISPASINKSSLIVNTQRFSKDLDTTFKSYLQQNVAVFLPNLQQKIIALHIICSHNMF